MSFSGLEHGGRQILGLKSQKLLSPEHRGEGNGMELYVKVLQHMLQK
jgi:hypothetical protein